MKLFTKLSNSYLHIKTKSIVCRFYATKRKKPLLDPDLYIDKMPIYQYPTANSGDRRVYSWGLSETGALGIYRKESTGNKRNKYHYTHFPSRMTFGEVYDVTCITCGYGFTAFGVKSKDRYQLFGTGINTNSQIGFHDPRKGHPLETLLLPAPIRLPLINPSETRVVGVSAGRAHLAVLTNDEGVFTLGDNSHGQCGRRVIENEDYKRAATIHNIKQINGEKITNIECGQDHSMFLTESGKVYACGWGSDGQLGNGNLDSDYHLNQVQGDILGEKIVKLSSSADCILAINDKGQVFGWGNSEYGQINFRDKKEQQIALPKALEDCNQFGKIVDVAAGGSHCLMLNSHGKVFAWGFGILGLGPEAQQSHTPLKIPTTLFGVNQFNPYTKVVQIAAGLSHSAAVTSNGDLYMWGANKSACLGLGDRKDRFFPLRVGVGAHVTKIALGVDHTVALCKPFI
ncbi:RCC1-like G exchanging factor-like protein [Arctopsyche grandis]|uniref:RCC1-like G exchanging factor-like protein n=1 Tax=Arctopsyche grandis TaxID=121162 RepID=UPI00406D639C